MQVSVFVVLILLDIIITSLLVVMVRQVMLHRCNPVLSGGTIIEIKV